MCLSAFFFIGLTLSLEVILDLTNEFVEGKSNTLEIIHSEWSQYFFVLEEVKLLTVDQVVDKVQHAEVCL